MSPGDVEAALAVSGGPSCNPCLIDCSVATRQSSGGGPAMG